jgi:hypothetical protein
MVSSPRQSNDEAVRDIATWSHVDIEEVQVLFEEQLAAVDGYARVKMYVPIFAVRRTREQVRMRLTNRGFMAHAS